MAVREEMGRFMAQAPCVVVRTKRVWGSGPRESGSFMLVAEREVWGTIGGGQLEYIAIDKARGMLRRAENGMEIEVLLGPDIGQCCGGRVLLSLARVDETVAGMLLEEETRRERERPHVYVMGAGHVGRALALALRELPLKTIVLDSRKKELAMVCGGVEARLSVLAEAEIVAAPPGSAFVVMTHDHGQDFLLARQALLRGDGAYVGMIGSKSKRAAFAGWMKRHGAGRSREETKKLLGGLTCPIGGGKLRDKRPQVIAALVAAEILVHTVGRCETGAGAGREKAGECRRSAGAEPGLEAGPDMAELPPGPDMQGMGEEF